MSLALSDCCQRAETVAHSARASQAVSSQSTAAGDASYPAPSIPQSLMPLTADADVSRYCSRRPHDTQHIPMHTLPDAPPSPRRLLRQLVCSDPSRLTHTNYKHVGSRNAINQNRSTNQRNSACTTNHNLERCASSGHAYAARAFIASLPRLPQWQSRSARIRSGCALRGCGPAALRTLHCRQPAPSVRSTCCCDVCQRGG